MIFQNKISSSKAHYYSNTVLNILKIFFKIENSENLQEQSGQSSGVAHSPFKLHTYDCFGIEAKSYLILQ